ncbi:ATP synthase subunit I [Paenibacillus albiflavus]|uniref:ATP synthase subunit I n=1 Tax=Paenibacillus albiflavus TaxID=2545760 RepID=A0A4R4DZ66_9BACL|nr:ATP synthase subunit I [Paenibacillus albiflavus]TCZ69365.1 ATP synthase subunit I [Paenibacillus albiflavus]
MNELNLHIQRLWKFTYLFLLLCFIGWVFLTSYRSIIAGLMLGTAVSTINVWYTAFKVRQFTDAVVERKKRIGLGFFTRLAISLLAVMLAIKSAHFEVVTTIIGFLIGPLAAILLGLKHSKGSLKQ